jgi:hypothetical protein
MPLETTFRNLSMQLSALREMLEALGTTVEEDRPSRGDVAVTTHLSDAILAARGTIEESWAEVERVTQAIRRGPDRESLRWGLIACQDRFHRFATQFHSELMSYERIDDLVGLGRTRGSEWAHWMGVVRQELEQCQAAMNQVRDALFLCWQELLERQLATSVSVHNTAVGQQISTPDFSAKEIAHKGAT